MIFPYFKYKNPDGTHVELPLLSLRIASNRKHVRVWALVDSGADITVFNGSIGRLLDIEIKKGRALELHGFVDTKDKYAAYTHQVNLAVQGLQSVDRRCVY